MNTQQRGFTIIELMTVVTVLALIAATAAPGLRSFAAGQRVKSLAFDLTADLLLARSEALKRNRPVTLLPAAAGLSAGWTVTSEGVELSRRGDIGEALLADGAPALITFNPFGRVSAPTAPVRITLRSLEADQPSAKRCVALDLSGRAGSQIGACV